jgi:hypothetical protein
VDGTKQWTNVFGKKNIKFHMNFSSSMFEAGPGIQVKAAGTKIETV